MDLVLLGVGFAIGIFSGIISGAFGISASSIKIVLLRVLLGVGGAVAIATALPLGIPAAVSGTLVYQKHRLLKYKTIITCGITGALFSVAGAFATQYVPDALLMLLLGFVLLAFAYLTYTSNGHGSEKRSCKQTLREKAGYTMLIGAVAGFASGFLGIGGGVVVVPLLARLRKITYKQAIPCSLAIMLFYVVPASIAHLTLGHLDFELFGALLAGSVLGAFAGAKLVVKTKEGDIKKWFAGLLAGFGGMLIFHEINSAN
ncbi:TSUP family transporter [Candidatus Micrarchaeota archaeon]|nr:TSUP family transporter [Candidatus Micrarchaeota archaeon]